MATIQVKRDVATIQVKRDVATIQVNKERYGHHRGE
jgi:hypothetical protein